MRIDRRSVLAGIAASAIAGRAAAASGWSPSFLGSALIAWYTADPAFVTLANGNVSAWAPKVGTAMLTQSSASAQPAYGAGALAGADALSFNGSTQFIDMATTPAAFPVGGQPGEIWALVDQQSTGTARRAVSYGAALNNTARQLQLTSANKLMALDDTIGVNTQALCQGRHVLGARFRGNGEVMAVQDRIRALTGTGATSAATAGRFRVGAAAGTTASEFWQGLISDVLVTSALSEVQADQLVTWGMRKIGLRA